MQDGSRFKLQALLEAKEETKGETYVIIKPSQRHGREQRAGKMSASLHGNSKRRGCDQLFSVSSNIRPSGFVGKPSIKAFKPLENIGQSLCRILFLPQPTENLEGPLSMA